MEPLVLASGSPRRREILTLLGIPFEVCPASSEEAVDPRLPLDEAVAAVAAGKAREIAAAHPGRTVLAADTVVVLGDQLLGKPRDEADARRMLRSLQGCDHEVLTGVWLFGPALPVQGRGFTDRAKVSFYPMDDGEIDDYIATGEPMDKAGSYGVQGKGSLLVEKLNGDFFNVMGLPVLRLSSMLSQFGVHLL